MVRKWIALMLVLLCLTGCMSVLSPSDESVGEYGLWYTVEEDKEGADHSDVVAFEPRSWQSLPSAQILLDNLLAGPQSTTLTSPFPAGVRVLDVDLDTGTETLYINLSEQYGSLSGFDLTVADYCIVMTMCQISGVNSVRVLVEGEPIPYRNRQNMQATDVMLSGIEDEPETFTAALYFPNRDNSGLLVEYRQVERSGDSAAEIIMTELLRGPMRSGTGKALPEGTQILGLSVSGTVCQIDLSSEFVDNAPQNGVGPTSALYALVNSLCSLGGISQVRVLVEGAVLQTYHGATVNNPVSANFELVKD